MCPPRYVPEQSEFHDPEGVFIICTLWLVSVLAQMDRLEEAEALFGRVTETANTSGSLLRNSIQTRVRCWRTFPRT